MTNRKKRKTGFLFLRSNPSWLSALIVGIGLGIASQHIPEIRERTDEAIQLLVKKLSLNNSHPF